MQALAGDSTDNVPGVRGIGIKTAAELINHYGDIETLLKRAGEIKQNKRRETLIENADNARISLRLVTLDDKVPLKEQPDEFAVHEPDPKELIAFLKAMEFGTITKRVAAHFEIDDVEAIAAATIRRAPAPQPKIELPESRRRRRGPMRALRAPDRPRCLCHGDGGEGPGCLGGARARRRALSASIPKPPRSIPCRPGLCGVSLAVAPGEACYIPCGHRKGDGLQLDLSSGQTAATPSSRCPKPMCWRG